MSYIDPNIDASAINASERAVIESYDFELRREGDRFVVIDLAFRKANRGKGGRHIGGNLSLLLTAAITQRKSLDVAVKAPSDKVERQNGRAKTNSAKTKPTVVEDDVPAGVNPGDGITGLTEAEAAALSVDAVQENAASAVPAASDMTNADAHVDARDAESADERPSSVPVGDAVEADAPKARKENRYLRAARLIIVEPSITKDELSKRARFSVATAGHCIEAWLGVTAALKEAGKLHA